MGHHAVEDLLILDESAWYAVFLRPTYQSMTHVYTNPRAGMSRTHTPNSSDQSSVTLAFQQKVKTVTSMSCWHMHALSSPTSLCDSLSPHYLCHLYANRPSDRCTCMKFWCKWAALIYICILRLIVTALCVRLLLRVSVTFVVMLHCLLLTVLLRKPVVTAFITAEFVLTEL